MSCFIGGRNALTQPGVTITASGTVVPGYEPGNLIADWGDPTRAETGVASILVILPEPIPLRAAALWHLACVDSQRAKWSVDLAGDVETQLADIDSGGLVVSPGATVWAGGVLTCGAFTGTITAAFSGNCLTVVTFEAGHAGTITGGIDVGNNTMVVPSSSLDCIGLGGVITSISVRPLTGSLPTGPAIGGLEISDGVDYGALDWEGVLPVMEMTPFPLMARWITESVVETSAILIQIDSTNGYFDLNQIYAAGGDDIFNGAPRGFKMRTKDPSQFTEKGYGHRVATKFAPIRRVGRFSATWLRKERALNLWSRRQVASRGEPVLFAYEEPDPNSRSYWGIRQLTGGMTRLPTPGEVAMPWSGWHDQNFLLEELEVR